MLDCKTLFLRSTLLISAKNHFRILLFPQNRVNRMSYVTGGKTAHCHLIKERLKQMVISLIDNREVYIRVFQSLSGR